MTGLVVALRDESGDPAGWATITKEKRATALSITDEDEAHATGYLTESQSYLLTIDLADEDDRVLGVGPSELATPIEPPVGIDIAAMLHFRTGNAVGTVEVVVETAAGARLRAWVEVRSSKLDHDSQYQWMLAGVAQDGAELLLQSYAPAAVTLEADHGATPQGLYQELSFLSAILQRPHTREAFARVLRSPYVQHVDEQIEVPAGRAAGASSRLVRSVSKPGRRVPAPAGLVVETLPERLAHARPVADVDNAPNRFVRHVLDHWSSILDRARAVLTEDTGPHRRGQRDIERLSDVIDSWATHPKLRDVGRLTVMPPGNQVILRRPGYREIHQAFLESRAAAMLRWDAVGDVNAAGQQDIASLYEYWCYLQLRRLVEAMCDYFDPSPLVELDSSKMHLRLRRGDQRVLSGLLLKHGRQIDVELWFNRTFPHGGGSWSMQLRPDCSILFRAESGSRQPVQTWVHFDAKYRVRSVRDLDVDDDAPDKARQADLLKMHAYRDAIRDSAGSYVLYPGDEKLHHCEHHEILPGLGAFPFVPASDGNATSASANAVASFLEDVIDHIARQSTNRERAAWWSAAAHSSDSSSLAPDYVGLDAPPADATILIGYYQGAEHLAWIEQNGLYNMRFDSRRGAVEVSGAEASAATLIVWSERGTTIKVWRLRSRLSILDADEMAALAYPHRPGDRYLCRHLDGELPCPEFVDRELLRAMTATVRPFGRPIATTWAALLETAGS